ncbi:hypothetical protein HanIR_Chr15g0767861 [Helianthus annuus]|nr:hypothetical protein HanIR_Chr15g0767861 [Helianthus annuus]
MFVLNFVYMFVCIFYKHSGLVSRSLCNIIHKLKHMISIPVWLTFFDVMFNVNLF